MQYHQADLLPAPNIALGNHRIIMAPGVFEHEAQAMQQTLDSKSILGRPMISLVVFLFFFRGFCTVLVDSLIPQLRAIYELSYTQAMFTQFCFYFGYLFFSVPAACLLSRLGYMRAIVSGLAVMMTGCLLFSPAASLGVYEAFLASLFVLAAGITLLQVTTNPLVAALGSARSSYSRLTLAQAFNSLGTTIAPLVGAWLILKPIAHPAGMPTAISGADRLLRAHALQVPFLAVACVLAALALVFWLNRGQPVPALRTGPLNSSFGFRLLRNRRFLLGVISIFLYVGAEVSIGSVMINYLTQSSVLAVATPHAGALASLYWGGAMCGRFLGSAALRFVPAGKALSVCSLIAGALALTSSYTGGTIAAATIIAIGLFNSIMFPTIFALALEGLGADKPEGSGMLCMAIVGGAIVPLLTGLAADSRGLAFSLLVPAACYMWIAFYGNYMGRRAKLPADMVADSR